MNQAFELGLENTAADRHARQAHDQYWQDQQRNRSIAQNQDAAMNISQAIRTGIHPDTGAKLNPMELSQLAQKHTELQAQLSDLFNPRQQVGQVGPNLSAATGVKQPPSTVRKLTDMFRITKPPAEGARETITPSTQAMTGMDGVPLAATQGRTVTGPVITPAGKMQDLQSISDKWRTLPGQHETQMADAKRNDMLTAIQSDPNLTPEQKTQARDKIFGVGTTRAQLKQFKLQDGSTAWLDASRPDAIPQGAQPIVNQTVDVRKRQDFDAFKQQNPEYKGTFEQWGSEQTSKGHAKAAGLKFDNATGQVSDAMTGKRYNRWDQNAPASVADVFRSQKELQDQKAAEAAKVAAARGASFGAGRFGDYQDPHDQTQVIAVSNAEAEKRGLHRATGAAYGAETATLKSAAAGPIAVQMVAFNTSILHADQLEQAARALGNSDMRGANAVANKIGIELGSDAQTNYNTIAGAYQREVTKALSAGHITDSEIAQNGATIPLNGSLPQLLGAINAYRKLMNSKSSILRDQIHAGMSGKPYVGQASKGNRSLKQAMAVPAMKGKTADEVRAALETHGYTVIP